MNPPVCHRYRFFGTGALVFLFVVVGSSVFAAEADLILHNGKVVTVDPKSSIRQAIAISGGEIVAVGADSEVLPQRGARTQVIDLKGKVVLPGLIDSHVHPGAAMTEFDHPIPQMESISDVLDYIRSRTQTLKEGEWIYVRQVFITRLREQRYPTRKELDEVAPKHPVNFSTGPDNMLNSLALKLSGITKDFKVTDGGPGYLELDPKTGDINGMLRGLARYVKMKDPGRDPTEQQTYDRTLELFRDYLSIGLTTVADRGANAGSAARYQKMKSKGDLPLRLRLSHTIPTIGSMDSIRKGIEQVIEHPLRKPDPWLQIVGTKIWLDGGMLTGSAYMLKPWGISEMYGITDAAYRGVLNVPKDRLKPMVEMVARAGLQFTAHAVGDGAVHTLLEVYEELDRDKSIRETRPCFTHCNFMTDDAVKRIARLGGVIDIQPAWLYLDTRTLENQFSYERLRYFQPLQSIYKAGGIAGGGSDHMQKIGSLRSINPYNPFLAMWVTITRKAKGYDGRLHPEEALTREQAIRFYTMNNAHVLFMEKLIGSIEKGKRADLVVLDRDILTCPEDQIKDIQPLQTYVDGKLRYERK